jgi:F0F1-type ATP synthase assembly protein I
MVRPTAEEPDAGAGAGGNGGRRRDLRPPGLRKMGGAYQAALEAVFAIPIAVAVGYFVDKRFETFPVFLLVGVVMGFAAFVLRLVRLARSIVPAEGSEPANAPERSSERERS